MDIEENPMLQIILSGTGIQEFRSAVAKIYQHMNRPGYDHMGLTKEERWAFNEVVETMANESDT